MYAYIYIYMRIYIYIYVRFPFRRFTVFSLSLFFSVSRFPFCRFSRHAVSRIMFSVSRAALRIGLLHVAPVMGTSLSDLPRLLSVLLLLLLLSWLLLLLLVFMNYSLLVCLYDHFPYDACMHAFEYIYIYICTHTHIHMNIYIYI